MTTIAIMMYRDFASMIYFDEEILTSPSPIKYVKKSANLKSTTMRQ